MHHLDRTRREMEWESDLSGEYEDEYAYDEYEAEGEYEDEYEYEGEYEREYEQEYDGEYALENPLTDAEEMEFAAELLEVMDEEELDQFLGKVWSKIKSKTKKLVPKSIRTKIGGALRGLARKGLGIAGKAVGTYFGGPAGGAIGGRLASGAGSLFGLELEGLSPEDQEFEVARRFVRVAAEAAKQASMAPPSMPPQAVANKAVSIAMKKHASGRPGKGGSMRRGSQQGIWKRRGKEIILYGA